MLAVLHHTSKELETRASRKVENDAHGPSDLDMTPTTVGTALAAAPVDHDSSARL